MLQQPLKEDLDRLQKQQIIVPLDVDETSEWCSSFVLVPMTNGKVIMPGSPKVQQSVDQASAQGANFNDILPRQAGVKYLIIIYQS